MKNLIKRFFSAIDPVVDYARHQRFALMEVFGDSIDDMLRRHFERELVFNCINSYI